jgi:ADP-heptose:LPS heptosyltransferase
LLKQQFDLVLDPQGLTKSALLGWLSGAKMRIGFDTSHARELAPWLATHRVSRSARHMVDTYRQLLEPWRETEIGAGEFRMPVYGEAVTSLNEKLSSLALAPEWLCINVGAGWPTKLWPPERFAAVGQAIHRSWGLRSLVVWSGESELRAAQQVISQLGTAGVLAPATTLPELAELLRRSKMLVSSDTGPAHLAAAVGTPSVVLFGPTWGDECGPYGRQHRVVQSIVMPPRGAPKRSGKADGMHAIQVDEVLDACEDLLAGMSAQRVSA